MAPRRYSLILFAALATAGVATFAIYRVLSDARSGSRMAMRNVVVAARDVAEGASLERAAVQLKEWPAATVPQGAYASLDSVVGRVARVSIFPGEAIVPGRLAPSGTGPGIQVKIAPGKRAMAVRIDDVAGVSGLIQPNSRVDVLVTQRESSNGERQVAKVFMENMRVLSVGNVVTSSPDNRAINATTVTLEVEPAESERLAVAMREGTIQLVLRGYGDPDSVRTQGARSSDVLSRLRVASSESATKNVNTRSPAARRSATITASVPTVEPPVMPVQQTAARTSSQPMAPQKPDSHMVKVYRGEKETQQKFEVGGDSTKKRADSTIKKPEHD